MVSGSTRDRETVSVISNGVDIYTPMWLVTEVAVVGGCGCQWLITGGVRLNGNKKRVK